MWRTGQGSIVNVSSVSGIVGDGSSIPYVAPKGAPNTMTGSLVRLLAPEIRVNPFAPTTSRAAGCGTASATRRMNAS